MEIRSVLLVDDDDHIRLISALTLKRVGGWTVVEAASGVEAIQKALAERPDVILLDVMMPGIDGMETLRRLREHEAIRDVPVIFLTAKVQRAEIAGYLALGARGVISKPFDPMTLPQQLRDILATEPLSS